MKITEMQDKLEKVQNRLSAIYETTNAVSASLEYQILRADQVGFAMSGIMENIDIAVREIGDLVEETIKVRSVVESL